ncbi:MAG: hypothetical protein KBF12_00070 [Sebaldella sp.]|nr:hypothetical protein [Sebaldella sp.]
MDKEKISKITESLDGLTKCEWEKIKAFVDMEYNRKFSKIKLADLEELNKVLEREFTQ